MLPSHPCKPSYFLASQSPRRKELLQQVGLHFKVVESSEPEPEHPQEIRTEADIATVVDIARAKARGGYQALRTEGDASSSAVVIAADTLVFASQKVLGKPKDLAHAQQMLRLLSGSVHTVATGVVLLRTEAGKVTAEEARCVQTVVTFRSLSDADIEWYLAQNEYQDKAGAYGIQGVASAFVTNLSGSFTNVVGLPLCETLAMLQTISGQAWYD